MAEISHAAAGPEWAYLASLNRSNGSPTDLDSLFVNVVVQRKNAKPDTKIFSLQTLSTKPGLRYGPHDVLRFSFARLRELTGSGDLDLFFYESGLPGVAIPDESSFQRLLLAVHHLGLATPESAGERIYAPPVLRFFAQPKPLPKPNSSVVAVVNFLFLLCLVFVITLLWYLGPGPVVLGLLVIGAVINQSMRNGNENGKK